MSYQRASWATWSVLAVLLAAFDTSTIAATPPIGFSALDYDVRIDATEDTRSWVVTPWVDVALPQGADMIKPLILVATHARDSAGKDILCPNKDFVDEKYMLRQQRLATWESKINLGIRIPINGPCPAVLKDVQGELAAEVADKLTVIKVPIEAGKEFDLAPDIKAKIVAIGPVEMYGRKGLKITYSYLIPNKPSDILPVQIAKFALYDATDKAINIDTRTGTKETVIPDGITIEGGIVIGTDTGKPTPTQIEFTVATGITIKHFPAPVGDVDLHGIKDLQMAKGPIILPEHVQWLADVKMPDGYQVGISAAKVQLRQVNYGGKVMNSRLAELTLALQPPEGVPAFKLIDIGFTATPGSAAVAWGQKLPDEAALNQLAKSSRLQCWQTVARHSISMQNDSIPQTLSQLKGTAVIIAAGTIKHQDLPLENGASAELIKGVSVKIKKPGIPNKDGSFSIAYEYDLNLTADEANLPCYPRGWIMAEWVDDAGKTYPVGWPKMNQGFGFAEDSQPTPTGRHVKGTARFAAPPGFTASIVALRAYGGQDIALKYINFDLGKVTLMASPGMSPVE